MSQNTTGHVAVTTTDHLSITIGHLMSGTAEGDHALVALVVVTLAILVALVLRLRLRG